MTEARSRRSDVDWLRIVATYLLFPYHAAMIFNPIPFYHVRNAELSQGMEVFALTIGLWHMPLFFLLAGWATVPSLRARGGWGFARERLRRLAVPFVAGCLLVMPAVKYLELLGGQNMSRHGLAVRPALQAGFRQAFPNGLPEMAPFHETFWRFLPTFYTSLDRFTWAHLWFVAYLLTFTLVYGPLFAWLLRRAGEPARVGALWVYAPIVPLVLVQLVLRPYWPGVQNLYDDWANVGFYSVFLIAGFLLARYPAAERALVAERRHALALAAIAALTLAMVGHGKVPGPPLWRAAVAVVAWSVVVGLLGYARFWRLPEGRVLAYLGESALPVYILHQLAVVVIGYWVVQLPLGVGAKFALVVGLAVPATLAVYHVLVRPYAVVRFAFGMPPKRRAALLFADDGRARAEAYSPSAWPRASISRPKPDQSPFFKASRAAR